MKRQDFGISQNKLATASGITRPYLSDIENGKAVPTEQVKLAILDALERFNPDNPLDMLFDYVRIRFPTDNIHHVVEEILHLKLDYMIHEDFGYYSYPEHYRFGDIMVLASVDLTKGILLELKGKGCRQYENFLLAQHRSWYDFFIDCLNANGIFKRLDLAINDRTGILNIPELARKCKQEECISVFRSFKNYRSGELVHRDEKPDMGNTLYIGSLKSEVYFCIYEKDYEQFVKNDVPLEDAEVKNRFEIRLKNDRATHAIKDLLTYQNAEKTAFEIINRYIRFVDKDNTKRRSDWQTNEQWKIFIGKNRGELRLTTKPEPYTFERTLNWLRHQVAPTLKVTSILDVLNETDILPAMIREAKLTEKHEKLIEQQHLDVEDVIL
ncbi:MobT family relaxase [Listeria innocua]